VLEVKNLKVRYRNGAIGVRDVSFNVEPGKIVALFGPNGAGKTTSVRAASGFLRTEGARVIEGSVTLAGEDVTNLEPHRTSSRGVAFVPERNKVFPRLSVAENLSALGRRYSRSRRAELHDQVFDLFPVLKERRRELAGRLSGGQQQMLAIARGLVSEPSLLIVDEMTLGLHHSMHGPLFEAVRHISDSGTAVIIVDESTGFALRAASYCYLLVGGRVRAEGPSEQFRDSELVAAGYVEAPV
jgi:branched-chain amino acid transport system ATP-binding protein